MEFGIDIPQGKPYDAVALGLNAVDHLVVVPHYPEFNTKIAFITHKLAPGGQCASAMVALSRLGLRTRYIGAIGNDDIGQFQLKSITDEGVDAGGVRVVEGAESQTAVIIIDRESGERTILWHRDDKLLIPADEVDPAAVTSGRVLLLDCHNVEASIAAARYAREAGVPVVIDIDNIYPGAERLFSMVDFLISSSSFPERLTGEKDLRVALKKIHEQTGSFFVAATQGVEGVLAYFKGQFIHSPAFKVECRDTTGAGDAFHAGFIYGLLCGHSVEETLRVANAVAALKCRALGCRTALPTRDELNSFLSSQA
jgi:sugar/nucleoside kinase (ribokinase family)